jgi:hypothetical protein
VRFGVGCCRITSALRRGCPAGHGQRAASGGIKLARVFVIEPMFEVFDARLKTREAVVVAGGGFDHFPDHPEDHRVAGLHLAHVNANIRDCISQIGLPARSFFRFSKISALHCKAGS